MRPQPTSLHLAIAMSVHSRLSLFILAFSLFAYASAQFQFFNGMFGHPQQQQQPSGGQQWAMHADSRTSLPSFFLISSEPSSADLHLAFISMTVSCSEYLCQDTLVCVAKPMDCPCPNVEDIKCVVPDVQDAASGTRLCIRGGSDCGQLEKLVKKFSQ